MEFASRSMTSTDWKKFVDELVEDVLKVDAADEEFKDDGEKNDDDVDEDELKADDAFEIIEDAEEDADDGCFGKDAVWETFGGEEALGRSRNSSSKTKGLVETRFSLKERIRFLRVLILFTMEEPARRETIFPSPVIFFLK